MAEKGRQKLTQSAPKGYQIEPKRASISKNDAQGPKVRFLEGFCTDFGDYFVTIFG